MVKCQGIDIVHGIFGHSGDGISSTQDVDTGHDGVSRSHYRRLIDLPLHPGAPCKRNGGMSQDLSVCRYALSPWSEALQATPHGEQHAPERRHAEEASFQDVMLG